LGRFPTTHIATAPRQVWCWDMTCLPATVAGQWFHLYLVVDLYSRKIVCREVHETGAADHAVRRTALAEGVKPSYSRPRVSDDNAYAEAVFRTAK
jgi:transposase InsO family protein